MSIGYKFPKIETLSDVMPWVDDYFTVKKDQNDLTFINYNFMSPEVFPTVVDTGTAIRREFRGIAFGPDGKIISRPFQKFFNLGERSDMAYELNYMSVEKLDGSMIRPIHVGGDIRWGTKAGITDVALQAEAWVAGQRHYYDFVEKYKEFTPLFEFVSPDNKIVLEYPDTNLVLLALRHNTTGEYVPRFTLEGITNLHKIPLVRLSRYLPANVAGLEGEEGIVLYYPSGHMLKVKSEWYVRLHTAKELIDNPRRLTKMILNNELDDVLPQLDPLDQDRIKDYESSLGKALKDLGDTLDVMFEVMQQTYATKKLFATGPTSPALKKETRSGIFQLWDQKVSNGMEFWTQQLLRSTTKGKTYEAFVKEYKLPEVS